MAEREKREKREREKLWRDAELWENNAAGALFFAAEWNDEAMAKEALKLTDNVNQQNKYRETALWTAIEHMSTTVFKMFMGHKMIDLSMEANGVSLLACAARGQREEMFYMLLERVTAENINEQCSTYNTPLAAAAKAGNANYVHLLLKRQADITLRGGRKAKTALEEASQWSDAPMVELLLQHRAKEQIQTSPGVIARAASGHGSHAMAQVLYDNSADLNEKYCGRPEKNEGDEDADTDEDDEDDHGSDWEEENYGKTALTIAAMRGHHALLHWLLGHDAIQPDNTTLLEPAVLKNQAESIRILLMSPKVEIADDQLTELHKLALHKYFSETAKILRFCIGKPAAVYRQTLQDKRPMLTIAKVGLDGSRKRRLVSW
ncbi:hypothetical protein NQ176_g6681 [Zarea fungicola]|uniref:Uncharacterized protein n=1 Tax=Zarea fungicola TaxID=93591 RepID=A0ACC1N248_9HYPO|nr:hypothetical protein NQ176_g6681 [Lecanicillium fungicola]